MPTPIFAINAGCAVLVNGYDLSRFFRSYTSSASMAAIQNTRFRSPGYAHEFVAGLISGAVGVAGDFPFDAESKALLDAAIVERGNNIFIVAPAGMNVGNFAEMGTALKTTRGSETSPEGLVSYSADFQRSASDGYSGVAEGRSLQSPHTGTWVPSNQKYNLAASAVTASGVFTVKDADGNTLGTVTIVIGDSAGTVDGKIEALNYSGSPLAATVTGSVALSGPDLVRTSSPSYAVSSVTNPANAFDGNNATSAAFASAGYLTVDLGVAKAITHVRQAADDVANGNSNLARTAKVSGANAADFSDEVYLVGSSGAAGTVPYATPGIAVSNPGSYRYLRYVNSEGTTLDYKTIEFLDLSNNGSYAVEITTPATTRLIFETATAGWSADEILRGGELADLNLITTAFNSTALHDTLGIVDEADEGEPTTSGALAVLQTVFRGAPGDTFTGRIQHSPDDGSGNPTTWSTLIAFDAVTDIGVQVKKIDPGTDIHPHVRFAITAGQITGTFAMGCAFARFYP